MEDKVKVDFHICPHCSGTGRIFYTTLNVVDKDYTLDILLNKRIRDLGYSVTECGKIMEVPYKTLKRIIDGTQTTVHIKYMHHIGAFLNISTLRVMVSYTVASLEEKT